MAERNWQGVLGLGRRHAFVGVGLKVLEDRLHSRKTDEGRALKGLHQLCQCGEPRQVAAWAGILEAKDQFVGARHLVQIVVGQRLAFGTRRELELMKDVIDRTAEAVFAERGKRITYLVGTMIELPRAALMAGEIAEVGAFFSFGTNDLTQTTLGVSRDDASRFLTQYVDKGIYAQDPFVSLDIDGVGQLVQLAAERGRATRPDIKLGICGEHGGDPASIHFCERVGLDYVSASPYRVPIARLAAAQAALRKG